MYQFPHLFLKSYILNVEFSMNKSSKKDQLVLVLEGLKLSLEKSKHARKIQRKHSQITIIIYILLLCNYYYI